jgi:hypothetical protein
MALTHEKVLTLLVNQFKARHGGKAPKEIVVHPVALAALALKQSVAPRWNGIPVSCREIKPKPESQSDGANLGITVYEGVLRGFDI